MHLLIFSLKCVKTEYNMCYNIIYDKCIYIYKVQRLLLN